MVSRIIKNRKKEWKNQKLLLSFHQTLDAMDNPEEKLVASLLFMVGLRLNDMGTLEKNDDGTVTVMQDMEKGTSGNTHVPHKQKSKGVFRIPQSLFDNLDIIRHDADYFGDVFSRTGVILGMDVSERAFRTGYIILNVEYMDSMSNVEWMLKQDNLQEAVFLENKRMLRLKMDASLRGEAKDKDKPDPFSDFFKSVDVQLDSIDRIMAQP